MTATADCASEDVVGRYPSRIVCLTEETTETLYLLGAQDRIVGISGYTVRPREARQKPRVSAFLSARFDKIEALEPDLILAFSDLQADIAAELARRGHSVVIFNQRSVDDILTMILTLAGMVGCQQRGEALVSTLANDVERIRQEAATDDTHPRVYFEEWDDPLISGIRWVEELIEIAGGQPIFPELRHAALGKDRIVAADEVIRRNPEVIIASWCGKPVRRERIAGRPGWDDIAAVRRGEVHEIKSTVILQPGPAALTDGVQSLRAVIKGAAARIRKGEQS